jgi:anti-sigma B factor antagonist
VGEIQIRDANGPNGIRTLHLDGPLTLNTLFEFQQIVRQGEPHALIISLAGVPYIDSAGLGAILGAYASCMRHGRQFALVNISQRVLTLLRTSRVDTLVPRFETVEAAEFEFTGSAEGA